MSEYDAEDGRAMVARNNSPIAVFRIFCMVCLYYPLSVGLTFYQKWFIKNYKFPLFVVSCHYVYKYIFALSIRSILECWQAPRIRISFKEQLFWLAPIGICASLDIGLSNWALEYVTVSLYTMAKSSSILFMVAFSLILRLERWHINLGATAVLIAVGLFLFTWRSSQMDLYGLMLVGLASACTGVRWSMAQLVMQREQHPLRHPIDMMAHVQPWMLVPIIPLVILFEGSHFSLKSVTHGGEVFSTLQIVILIILGSIIAFAMELAEFLLLVNTSGVTLNIFGIIKEVVTLLLAHFFNGDHLTSLNLLGLLLCIMGMSLHAFSKRQSKMRTPITRKSDPDQEELISNEVHHR
ncbi:hypothetical protein AB6A40_003392 [Gnathostoma spinigerum]|uniref:Sugar phosphate transporter domain-containing protein n=1 Tax=Gnathostoma spinigerum TaxID=75299 RepID=A0ABD6E9L1_9BILA